MPLESPPEDKQKLLRMIEKILRAEHELDFLMQIAKADLERLVVAIRGRLDRSG